jgi:hypothetical protein
VSTRRAWLIPVIVALLAGSAGCQGKSPTGVDASPARSASAAPSAEPAVSFEEPTEPITLTFHVIGQSGYGDLVTTFMQGHPKITVEVVEHQDLASYVK